MIMKKGTKLWLIVALPVVAAVAGSLGAPVAVTAALRAAALALGVHLGDGAPPPAQGTFDL